MIEAVMVSPLSVHPPMAESKRSARPYRAYFDPKHTRYHTTLLLAISLTQAEALHHKYPQ